MSRTSRIGYIFLLFFLVPAVTSVNIRAQEKRHAIMFYNVENLFDTIKTPGIRDEEFTPDGVKAWNTAKYRKKLSNLDEVFYGVSSAARTYPAIIGVCEVEGRNVLEDLVSLPRMGRANYRIVHYDSPDARGVATALLYRPDVFVYEGSKPIRVTLEEFPDFRTRDILSVWGTIEDEKFWFFVCHWPSRLGGQSASEFRRMAAAQILRNAVDSIRNECPAAKIVIMGDMNDDPVNKSLSETLGASGNAKKIGSSGLFNPFYEMHKAGFGSLAYDDAWNLFDNIIVSETLLNGKQGEFKLYKSSDKYYGFIFDRPFLRQKSGQYKNYPLRTYVGNDFQGGYSDHFPVYIYIAR